MDIHQITEMLNAGEGLKIEFKIAKNSIPSSLYETVVSFSNTDGGTILLGVDDDGSVIGIDDSAVGQLQKDLVSTINSLDCIAPTIYTSPLVFNHPDGKILILQIPASSSVHDHAGRIYIREYEVDIDISQNQSRIADLYLRKRTFFTEAAIYPHLTMADLDSSLFDKARQLIRNYKSNHPWLLADNEQMLHDSVLWRKDFQSGQEGLTLAAALIFGKDSTIQSILPAYKAEAMVRIENKDRWDDRISPPLRTNLIDTYQLIKEFINKHLPEKFHLEADQRIDLRDRIFREIIGNIIVHREYTSAYPSEIIITESEVKFTNPNKPLFHGVLDPKRFSPYPKNPNIRKFFTAFGWTDEIGSGIRNTNKYLPFYSGGAKPIFMENDNFVTLIPRLNVTFAKFSKELFTWLELPEAAYDHLNLSLNNFTLPGQFHNTSWDELLLNLVPSWYKKGTELTILNLSKIKRFDPSAIQNVPSWNQKCTQLLNKKFRYILGTLMICLEPVKLKSILQYFEYANENSFKQSYLKPLREIGFIEQTIPDRPTDSNNKYVITENGKAFLSGNDLILIRDKI